LDFQLATWVDSVQKRRLVAILKQEHILQVNNRINSRKKVRNLTQLLRGLIRAQIYDNRCAKNSCRNSKRRRTLKSVANDTLSGWPFPSTEEERSARRWRTPTLNLPSG
jgi:hypothetical protein